MTTPTAQEAAGTAAEAVRSLNHATRPGAIELDVTDVYDVLAELALLAARLPQALRQLEDLLDCLVENDQVVIVDGDPLNGMAGDPVAVAAVTGHWLAAAAGNAHELAHRVDQAQQTLTWAARAER
jgi:hypothetical protein